MSSTQQPPDLPSTQDQRALEEAERRHRMRLAAATTLGALVTAFALLNLNDVKVHWLVATGQTPLIVVIAVAFFLGVLADRLLVIRARRRQRPPEPNQ